jgi:cytochrome bd ubiquinol oxidase subunit I
MDDFSFARAQMAMSLAFHIIFAVVGIAMPALMAVAEGVYLRTKQPVYLELAKRWATGTALLFAVGAVSGTVLSFELGLLWPKFMAHAGAIIGMPFSLEGFAFFTEAIFLGIYLYGWNRISPVLHWISGIIVAVSGMLSGIFVVMANAWMNAPTGFDAYNGEFTNINPVAAMFSPALFHQALHMTLAAYAATGLAVAGVHAWFLRRYPKSAFHRGGCAIPLAMACVAIPLQIISGDLSVRGAAKLQPPKFAAMEAHYHTGSDVPLTIGGFPDDAKMETHLGVEIPGGVSLLLGGSRQTVVPGLDSVPRDEWPNVRLVHWNFDIMVGAGMAMLAVAAWGGWIWIRTRRVPENRRFLTALVWASPLGFIAVETGWMVTELGRQPWVIYHVMRTRDAVTPLHGLVVPFTVFTILYLFLAGILVILLRRQFMETAPSHGKKGRS